MSLKKSWIIESSINASEEAGRIIDRAAFHNARGGKQRWATCFAARHIVGTYHRGKTLELARRLALSVSAVDKMAGAAVCYWVLRQWAGSVSSKMVSSLHMARDVLSFSHFYSLAVLWKKYEFGPLDAIRFVVDAAEHLATVQNLEDKINAECASGRDDRLDFPDGGLADPVKDTPASLLEKTLGNLTGKVTDVIPSGLGTVIVKVSMDSETAPSPGDIVKVVVIKEAPEGFGATS